MQTVLKQTRTPQTIEGDGAPDRLNNAFLYTIELNNSRLLEIKNNHKKRWSSQKRADQAHKIVKMAPWRWSTGPKTALGKQISAKNAWKHGFYGQSMRNLRRALHQQALFIRRVEQTTRLARIMWQQQASVLQGAMDSFDTIFRRLWRDFEQAGVQTPALDARLLARAGAGLEEAQAIANAKTPLSAQQIDIIEEFSKRRLEGEPVSRILGEREFWGLSFKLSPDTLDPRPETELLVERAVSYLSQACHSPSTQSSPRGGEEDLRASPAPRILDLGTGTGCIVLSILHSVPAATGVGVDLNPGAVAIARENAARLGLSSRADFMVGDWCAALPEGARFDLILSNPPYIPRAEIESLTKEVRFYDPILALDGGMDGLAPYKILFTTIKSVLNPGGRAVFEIGFGQADEVVRLAENAGATLIRLWPDLAGIPRVVEICYGDNEKNV